MATRTHVGVRRSLCNGSTQVTTDFAKVDCKLCWGLPWAKILLRDVVSLPAREVKLLAEFLQFCRELTEWNAALEQEMNAFLHSKAIEDKGELWMYKVGPDVYAWSGPNGFTLSSDKMRRRQEFSREDAERFDECLTGFLEQVA